VDEWLVIAPVGRAETIISELEGSDHPSLSTVLDMTHGGVLLRLTGVDSARLLEKVCAIDLSDRLTPDRAVFRSSVARVTTEVIRDDVGGLRSYLLHSDRSSGQYLFDALLDAGEEFGIEIDGFSNAGF